MCWIDWFIVLIAIGVLLFVGFKVRKYAKDVSCFLSGGRVAGRYVLAVASGEGAFGLISVVGAFQAAYVSGFAYGFWNFITQPFSMVLVLTGFLVYRFRETRAMTLGQFFEVRYSKPFRIASGVVIAISGVVNYGLFPIVGARFLVYYMELPTHFAIFGMVFPTVVPIMIAFLSVAVIIVNFGGQITVMVTDCISGIMNYAFYLIIVIVLFKQFSWFDHVGPTLADRPPGESFINPYDVAGLRDFNLFFLFTNVLANAFYNRMSWQGAQGYFSAGLNAHEQKMGGILSNWRGGFASVMFFLMAACIFTFTHNSEFKSYAELSEREVECRALSDITGNSDNVGNESFTAEALEEGLAKLNTEQVERHKAIVSQVRLPVTMRTILPVGVTGVFLAMMIFLLISTDTTYLHSWGSIIIQDIVLPFRKTPLTVHQQLKYLRIAIVCVSAFAFTWSVFFEQVTYIMMFVVITGSIWLAGAGALILGGLYWSKGTTQAAWLTLITSALTSIAGFIGIHGWAGWIYPALTKRPEVLEFITGIVEKVSKPLEPIIMWQVTPNKFFMNAQEIFLLSIVLCVLIYIITSLLTCREKCNMDRLLHRGKYQRKEDAMRLVEEKKMKKNVWTFIRIKLLGIDEHFTFGDKVLSWSVFLYGILYAFLLPLVVLIWNFLSPWPTSWWTTYYFIYFVVIGVIIGVVSTIWFSVGGTLDLIKLFKRLKAKEENTLDTGRVIGHINAEDVEIVENVE